MDTTLVIGALLGAGVLLLGVIGALLGRSDREGRKRKDAEDLRRVVHDAFEPPKWWERGKARDQAAYRRAIGQGSAASINMLMKLTNGERKRQARRRRVLTTAIVLGGGLATALATALVMAPTETRRAFELFTVPGLFVLGGVVCNRFAVNWRFWKSLGHGFFISLVQYAVALAQVGLPIVGVVLGIMAAGRW